MHNSSIPDEPRPPGPTLWKRVHDVQAALPLQALRKKGFRHPMDGGYDMIPHEFDLILTHESLYVIRVVWEIIRQTIGRTGDGPMGRGLWVRLSYSHFERRGLMTRGDAFRTITYALDKGYLVRRPYIAMSKSGNARVSGYQYAIHWDNIPEILEAYEQGQIDPVENS